MSGQRKSPQARDRTLGAQLRAIRKEQTPYSLEAAAAAVGWSPSTLSRTENGKRQITPEDMAALLTIYKVPAAQRDEMSKSAREARQEGWWSRPLPGVLPDVGTVASYEADAHTLTNWAITIVPGLLQTEDYAKRFMILDGADPQDAEVRWMARLRRQQILRKLDYTAYIHEYALRTLIGTPEIMREQFEHLATASERGQRVRVVPERTVVGALMHSWLLMEFPDQPPVLYAELQRSGVFLHNDAVSVYEDVRSTLERQALSTAETRRLLEGLIGRL